MIPQYIQKSRSMQEDALAWHRRVLANFENPPIPIYDPLTRARYAEAAEKHRALIGELEQLIGKD